MRVEVEVLGRGKRVLELEGEARLGDVAEILGLRRVEYVPWVNGRIVTWDYRVSDGDEIKFIPVISGG